jgi:hypothetical protein
VHGQSQKNTAIDVPRTTSLKSEYGDKSCYSSRVEKRRASPDLGRSTTTRGFRRPIARPRFPIPENDVLIIFLNNVAPIQLMTNNELRGTIRLPPGRAPAGPMLTLRTNQVASPIPGRSDGPAVPSDRESSAGAERGFSPCLFEAATLLLKRFKSCSTYESKLLAGRSIPHASRLANLPRRGRRPSMMRHRKSVLCTAARSEP